MFWLIVKGLIGAIVGYQVFTKLILRSYFQYREWKTEIDKFCNQEKGFYNQIAKMDWKTVKNIYDVNPNRFKVTRVSYRNYLEEAKDSKHKMLLYNGSHTAGHRSLWGELEPGEMLWNRANTVAISLSYEDYKKWHQWIKDEDRRKEQEKEMASIQFALESAQKDIDKLQQQAQKEVHENIKKSAQIVDRMVTL